LSACTSAARPGSAKRSLRAALDWLGVGARSGATTPDGLLRDALLGFAPASLRRSSLGAAATL